MNPPSTCARKQTQVLTNEEGERSNLLKVSKNTFDQLKHDLREKCYMRLNSSKFHNLKAVHQ